MEGAECDEHGEDGDGDADAEETNEQDVDYLRDDRTKLFVPSEIQKRYPTGGSPPATTLGLASDTTRTLASYLESRWKDTPALFPSRSPARITPEGVHQILRRIAETADVRLFLVDSGRGTPSDVTPHALGHSVAWRMMNAKDRYFPNESSQCYLTTAKQPDYVWVID